MSCLPAKLATAAIAYTCLAAGPVCAQDRPASQPARFQIAIDARKDVARISVDAPLEGQRLFMFPFGAGRRPRGWAGAISNLEAHDAGGRNIAVAPLADASWRVEAPSGSRLRYSYTVSLDMTRSPWPSGNEEVGQDFGNALYLSTRPLIIAANHGSAEIELVLPGSWRIATSWMPTGRSARRFRVDTVEALQNSSFVVGDFALVEATSGRMSLFLALPGPARENASALAGVLQRVMTDYGALFSSTGRPSRYLMTYFYAQQDDGQAFLYSSAFTSATPPQPVGRLIWANFIAHETFHNWNGSAQQSDNPQETAWFTEGVTEYMANAALVRAGIFSSADWIRKAESHLGMYAFFAWSPLWANVGLADAGSSTSRNRPGVYDGGWVAALCLDAAIRRNTNDRRTLRDVLRLLDDGFRSAGTRYSLAAIRTAVSQAAGADLGAFFERHVSGSQPLPAEQCLSDFGLESSIKAYSGEFYIAPNPRASEDQRSRRMSLIRS